jgi:predicted PurR-regulated permease PerM
MDESHPILSATPSDANDGGIPVPRTRVDLPWPTVAKAIIVIAGAITATHLLGVLTPVLLVLLETLLVTAALTPPVHRLMQRGVSRRGAVAIVFVAITAVVALIVVLISPRVVDQGHALAKHLPAYVNQAQFILRRFPSLDRRIQHAANAGAADPSSILPLFLDAGSSVISGAANALAVIAMAAYLLAGGERSFSYALHFLPETLQDKVLSTAPEVVRVVSGYVFGQAIMSTLIATFTFVMLEATGVPQPILLAVLAGFLDAIPLVGTLIATAIVVLFALSVSQPIAIFILIAFLAYNVIESNVVLPHVYGHVLGISPFAVLVAILVGFQLVGLIGVFIALPMAAVIPAAERAWRKENLLIGTNRRRPSRNR